MVDHEHIWVPADLEEPEPRVCVRCTAEQMSDA